MASRALLQTAFSVLLTLTSAQPAFAGSQTVTDADRETARNLMDEADGLAEAGKHAEALKRYVAAEEIMHVPTTGFEVAKSLASLGQLVEARAQAIAVAHSSVEAGEPQVFREARVAALALADNLAQRIPSVAVQLSASVIGVQVRLNGVLLPTSVVGFPYKVNPGAQLLDVAAPGYRSESQRFELAEGEQRRLEVTLSAAAASSAPLAGAEKDAPGLAAPARQTTELSDPALIRGWAGIGLGALGLGIGAVEGLRSLSLTHDIKSRHCNGHACDAAAAPMIDRASTMALIADVGIGAGVACVGYGLYELIWGHRTGPAETSAQLLPGLERASLTLRVTGRF